MLTGTSIASLNYKDETILSKIINFSFWIIGVASIFIWFIMCVKDTIDEKREKRIRKELEEEDEFIGLDDSSQIN